MIQIRALKPLSTRPCRYCFALQDDSVFADFEVDSNGCLYLVRISFDGYGCCNISSKIQIGRVEYNKSDQLIKQIENDDFENSEASEILEGYFSINKAFI